MIKSRYLFSHQTDTAETSTWDFKAKARPQQCLRGGKSLPVIERFTGNWFLYTAFYPLRMTIQRWLFTPADLPSTKDTPNSSSGHHPVTTVQWLWSPGPPPHLLHHTAVCHRATREDKRTATASPSSPHLALSHALSDTASRYLWSLSSWDTRRPAFARPLCLTPNNKYLHN